MAASLRYRPGSTRSSSGRRDVRVSCGSAAERTMAMPVKPAPIMASTASMARSSDLPEAFAEFGILRSIAVGEGGQSSRLGYLQRIEETFTSEETMPAAFFVVRATIPDPAKREAFDRW